jgi:dynein heavy chain 1
MITDYQDIKRKHLEWSQEIEKFSSGNKLLERQRYKYPADWLELDKVMTEWSNFKQAFNKKTSQLETEMTRLQTKITTDENALNERIKEIENIWTKDKPSSGDMLPNGALGTLEILSSRVAKVKDDYEKCCQAKQLLGLTPGDTQKLEILQEEI